MDYFGLTAKKLHLECTQGDRFSVRVGDEAEYITLDATATNGPRESSSVPLCNRTDSRADTLLEPIVVAPNGERLAQHAFSEPGAEAFTAAADPTSLTSWWRHADPDFIKTRRVKVLAIESAAWTFVADPLDETIWRFDLANRRATLLLEDAACVRGVQATHSAERALVWCDGGDDLTPWAFLIDLTDRTTTLIEGGRELLLMPDGTVIGVVPMMDADNRAYETIAILQASATEVSRWRG
ncbi:MAG: hypothetical protein H6718_10460 [Polyangiaceae bacterium]|nr:hypothetical protein [Myxococcales bacterium]MCB9585814.1 hypothetical protein [Polyangiaceae bacterium]MCB9607257.1 hypothetical protein [Polyangiaceae bacterium]